MAITRQAVPSLMRVNARGCGKYSSRASVMPPDSIIINLLHLKHPRLQPTFDNLKNSATSCQHCDNTYLRTRLSGPDIGLNTHPAVKADPRTLIVADSFDMPDLPKNSIANAHREPPLKRTHLDGVGKTSAMLTSNEISQPAVSKANGAFDTLNSQEDTISAAAEVAHGSFGKGDGHADGWLKLL